MTDDAALVEAARGGGRAAFETLVARHQERVFMTAWGVLRHAEDARDAAQEAFLEGFRTLVRLEDPSRFGAWVSGIARHLALTARARRERQRPLEGAEPPVDQGDGPLMQLIQIEEEQGLRDTARRALDALPADLQEVLALRYEHDLSYDQIASRLSTSRDTVRGRLYRAHRKVQEEIARLKSGALR